MPPVEFKDYNTGPYFSPKIWADVDQRDVDKGKWLVTGDHFHHIAPSGSGYTRYEADNNASIAVITAEPTGVLRLAAVTDDNEECSLCYGGTTSSVGQIVSLSGYELRFECRFRLSNIDADAAAIFLGLTGENSAVNGFQVDNTGAPADMNYIGFRNLHTNGGADVNANLDAAYRQASGAEAVEQEAAQLMVATTWYKAGFVFNGQSMTRFYVDGAEVGNGVGPTAALFPDATALTFAAGLKLGGGGNANLDIDWWRAAYQVDVIG